jgi:hypothetical protein
VVSQAFELGSGYGHHPFERIKRPPYAPFPAALPSYSTQRTELRFDGAQNFEVDRVVNDA